MPSITEFLKQVKKTERGIYFNRRLSEAKIRAQADQIKTQFGVEVPEEYLELVHFTNGLQTQRGYLNDLEEIASHNEDIWEMESKGEVTPTGDLQIRLTPRKTPKEMTYLWLGYDGNSAQQIYDLKSGEFRQMVLGGTDKPLNHDRTLIGLLRHMIYREQQ